MGPRAARGPVHQPRGAWWPRPGTISPSLPVEQFPLITSMVDELTTGDSDARFQFGLDMIVAGLDTLRDWRLPEPETATSGGLNHSGARPTDRAPTRTVGARPAVCRTHRRWTTLPGRRATRRRRLSTGERPRGASIHRFRRERHVGHRSAAVSECANSNDSGCRRCRGAAAVLDRRRCRSAIHDCPTRPAGRSAERCGSSPGSTRPVRPGAPDIAAWTSPRVAGSRCWPRRRPGELRRPAGRPRRRGDRPRAGAHDVRTGRSAGRRRRTGRARER